MYVKMVMEMLKKGLYYAEITRECNIIIVRIDNASRLDFDKRVRLDKTIGILEYDEELKIVPDNETDMKSNFLIVSSDFNVYFILLVMIKIKTKIFN